MSQPTLLWKWMNAVTMFIFKAKGHDLREHYNHSLLFKGGALGITLFSLEKGESKEKEGMFRLLIDG